MYSVSDAARVLGVSTARVRMLITLGELPAVKVGKNWAINEAAVMERASVKPKPGRPQAPSVIPVQNPSRQYRRKALQPVENLPAASIAVNPVTKGRQTQQQADPNLSRQDNMHRLFLECREEFSKRPTASNLRNADSQAEASFYMAMFDFFLQQRQQDIVGRRNIS